MVTRVSDGEGQPELGPEATLVTVQPGTGNGRLALALALQLQLRRVFYAKAFSWFFEMGLVT